MPVEVVHTFEEKGKYVNVAAAVCTSLVCLIGNVRVSAPFLSNVPRPLFGRSQTSGFCLLGEGPRQRFLIPMLGGQGLYIFNVGFLHWFLW